ncbi:MAG: sigma 54-interacting transcriptional regulator [Dehalobacterium sp.]
MSEHIKEKEMIQKIAEAVAAVLLMDVTIVDDKLNRIAGTGHFKNNTPVPKNSVFEKAIQTGRSFIITNPKENIECGNCDHKQKCCETAEICCPIILGNKIGGVLGIVTVDEEKKRLFVEKQEIYLNFLEKMANLVAAKLSERQILQNLYNTKKELETTINILDYGIVSINSAYEITMCNFTCQKLLNFPKESTGFNFDFVFPEFEISKVFQTGQGYKEKHLSFIRAGRKYDFVATILPVVSGNICVSVVVVFQDHLNLKRSIHKVFKDDNNYCSFKDLIGQDKGFREVINTAQNAAQVDSNILITGESGTGKELFARAIHGESHRNNGLFVALNCAAIPEALLESELFGYEEGAFTGAKKGGKVGMFELANGGTIFLDEIGDMPLYLQAKLLRVIQEKRIIRVGGINIINLDIRIISATNKNLEELIKLGRFREDLYYRLNVIPINLPSLRNRLDDILLLTNEFIKKYNKMTNKNILGLDARAKEFFLSYYWPGNIRELENAVEYGVSVEKGNMISRETLSNRFSFQSQNMQEEQVKKGTLSEMLEQYETLILSQYLKEYGDSLKGKMRIARELNISKSTLYRKLTKITSQ